VVWSPAWTGGRGEGGVCAPSARAKGNTGHAVAFLSDRGKRGRRGAEVARRAGEKEGKEEGVGAGSVMPHGGEWGLARPTGGVWPARLGRGGHGRAARRVRTGENRGARVACMGSTWRTWADRGRREMGWA
jgi:hypothetical protein